MSPLISSAVPADQWVAAVAHADTAWGFHTINFMDLGDFALG